MLFDESVPPLERLKGHFNYLSERLIDQGFERGCMLGLFAAEMAREYPKMREELRLVFERWCGAVETVLRDAQAKGEVDPRHDPGEMARFLVNAWEGATIRLKITKDREPIDDFMNTAFNVFKNWASSEPSVLSLNGVLLVVPG